MSTSSGAVLLPPPPDPIDNLPAVDVIRDVIREHVRRTEILRHLLRVALRRDRLGLPSAPMPTARVRKAVRA